MDGRPGVVAGSSRCFGTFVAVVRQHLLIRDRGCLVAVANHFVRSEVTMLRIPTD